MATTLIHHYKDTKKDLDFPGYGAYLPGLVYDGTQTSTSGSLSMGWWFLYWRKSVGIPGKKPFLVMSILGLWANVLLLKNSPQLYGLSIFIKNKNPRHNFSLGGWDFSFVVRGSFLSILVKSYYHCSKGKYERYESQDAISRYRMY